MSAKIILEVALKCLQAWSYNMDDAINLIRRDRSRRSNNALWSMLNCKPTPNRKGNLGTPIVSILKAQYGPNISETRRPKQHKSSERTLCERTERKQLDNKSVLDFYTGLLSWKQNSTHYWMMQLAQFITTNASVPENDNERISGDFLISKEQQGSRILQKLFCARSESATASPNSYSSTQSLQELMYRISGGTEESFEFHDIALFMPHRISSSVASIPLLPVDDFLSVLNSCLQDNQDSSNTNVPVWMPTIIEGNFLHVDQITESNFSGIIPPQDDDIGSTWLLLSSSDLEKLRGLGCHQSLLTHCSGTDPTGEDIKDGEDDTPRIMPTTTNRGPLPMLVMFDAVSCVNKSQEKKGNYLSILETSKYLSYNREQRSCARIFPSGPCEYSAPFPTSIFQGSTVGLVHDNKQGRPECPLSSRYSDILSSNQPMRKKKFLKNILGCRDLSPRRLITAGFVIPLEELSCWKLNSL